ncbi:hypothetical protein SNEBB_006763 [Seison nebaliae]|nr:hypothetical protein SNEBB_006763 [Seison nebaliae]
MISQFHNVTNEKSPQIRDTIKEVYVMNGADARIPCVIKNLGAYHVIWKRIRNRQMDDTELSNILTVGHNQFSRDLRYTIEHRRHVGANHAEQTFNNQLREVKEKNYLKEKQFKQTNGANEGENASWDFVIRKVEPMDVGIYECSISSTKYLNSVQIRLYVLTSVAIRSHPHISVYPPKHTIHLLCRIEALVKATKRYKRLTQSLNESTTIKLIENEMLLPKIQWYKNGKKIHFFTDQSIPSSYGNYWKKKGRKTTNHNLPISEKVIRELSSEKRTNGIIPIDTNYSSSLNVDIIKTLDCFQHTRLDRIDQQCLMAECPYDLCDRSKWFNPASLNIYFHQLRLLSLSKKCASTFHRQRRQNSISSSNDDSADGSDDKNIKHYRFIDEETTLSIFELKNVKENDSGIYTCSYDDIQNMSIAINIRNGRSIISPNNHLEETRYLRKSHLKEKKENFNLRREFYRFNNKHPNVYSTQQQQQQHQMNGRHYRFYNDANDGNRPSFPIYLYLISLLLPFYSINSFWN